MWWLSYKDCRGPEGSLAYSLQLQLTAWPWHRILLLLTCILWGHHCYHLWHLYYGVITAVMFPIPVLWGHRCYHLSDTCTVGSSLLSPFWHLYHGIITAVTFLTPVLWGHHCYHLSDTCTMASSLLSHFWHLYCGVITAITFLTPVPWHHHCCHISDTCTVGSSLLSSFWLVGLSHPDAASATCTFLTCTGECWYCFHQWWLWSVMGHN